MRLNDNKIRVLGLLFGAGYTTEKQIQAISLGDFPDIPGFSLRDLKVIDGLRAAIRDRKVIEFFAENEENGVENNRETSSESGNYDGNF